jgi:hypothetical protein
MTEAGLGSVNFESTSGDIVSFKLTLCDDGVKLEVKNSENVFARIYLDDNNDVSDLISLLDSYFDYETRVN